MNYRLASSLLRGAWAIQQEFAQAHFPFVLDLLKGVDTQFENTGKSLIPFAVNPIMGESFEYDSETEGYKEITEGSVFVIPIKGTLMKADQMCGPMGTETLRKHICSAADNPKIIGGLTWTDSPGGTVDGTELLIQDLEYFKSKKPYVDFVDGLEASAALWATSHAEYRIASTELDLIGSIGVLMSFWDIIPYYEAQGLKYHQIVSNLSPDKTKIFDDLRKGDYEEYKKKVLDPIAKEFQKTITKNLPGVTKDMMTGEVYFAGDVKGTMIDDIGTLDDAIELATDMGKKRFALNNSNKNAKNMNFKHVAALLALASIELDADNMASLAKEQLGKIESSLAAADGVASELATTKQALADKTTELASATTDYEQAIADLNTEHKEATDTLTADHATALQEKDDQIIALGDGAGGESKTIITKKETTEPKSGINGVAKGNDVLADMEAVGAEYNVTPEN